MVPPEVVLVHHHHHHHLPVPRVSRDDCAKKKKEVSVETSHNEKLKMARHTQVNP